MSKTTTQSGRAAARSTAPEIAPKKAEDDEDPTQAPEDAAPGDPGDEDMKKSPAASAPRTPRLAQAGPATIKELKAACPKADAEFREKCLEDGLTLAEAKDRYTAMLEEKLDTKSEAPSAPAQPSKRSGVSAIGTANASRAETTASATQEFNTLKQRYIDEGMKSHEAHTRVCREQPELRERMVKEHNQTHRPR